LNAGRKYLGNTFDILASSQKIEIKRKEESQELNNNE